MPQVRFRYYVLGLRDLVRAGEYEDSEACDAANCFLGLALENLKTQPRYIQPVMPQLFSAVWDVATDQA